MNFQPRPMRVLHVVGGMNIGGTETWLMHILRKNNPKHFQMDFLVHTETRCTYDDEIRALGSRVIPCLKPSRLWSYASNFRKIIARYGPYDIVHSHVHHFSGLVLRLAYNAQVPFCIAHSHSDTSRLQSEAGLRRRIYQNLMTHWIQKYATVGLSVSRKAAFALFGPNWEDSRKYRVIHCGVDLAPFRNLPDASIVRKEFNIPRDAFLVGHVGNFGPPKNHVFLVEIARELVRREPQTRFLWIGDGKLRSVIQEKVTQAGLNKISCFTGSRQDVPRLLGAMDVFVFPSLWEGMPLSLIEAQAAGLPCFVSDTITNEAHVVKPLITQFSLMESAGNWSDKILANRNAPKFISRAESLLLLEQSSFSVESSYRGLEAIYSELLF
jgi:glycosyltransferase involved in cell wall biosynthesis